MLKVTKLQSHYSEEPKRHQESTFNKSLVDTNTLNTRTLGN